MLVIFVPTIRDIFGFIGKHLHISSGSLSNLRKCSSDLNKLYLPVYEYLFLCFFNTGASAAAMLIFILPSAFYIKLVKKEPMKSVQKIGVCVDKYIVITLVYKFRARASISSRFKIVVKVLVNWHLRLS